MATPLDKAKKKVKKYSRQLESDRMGDFAYSLNSINALFANLAATQKGLGRTLTQENQRVMEALAKMSARMANQSNRSLNNASGSMLSSYGGLYSGQVSSALAPAEAVSDQVTTAGEAANITAKGLSRAGTAAMKVQQAGVAEAQAAAQYALGQAAIARAKADADAVAQMEAQLAIYDLQKSDQQVSSIFPGLPDVSKLAGNISKTARELIAKAVAEQGDGASVNLTEIAKQIFNNLALSTPEEQQLALYIVKQVYAQNLWKTTAEGATRSAEIELIVNAVMQSYNGDIKPGDRATITNNVTSYLKTIYTGAAGGATSGDGKSDGMFGLLGPLGSSADIGLSMSLARIKEGIILRLKGGATKDELVPTVQNLRAFFSDEKEWQNFVKWFETESAKY